MMHGAALYRFNSCTSGRLADLAFLLLRTRTSSTKPSWSTARQASAFFLSSDDDLVRMPLVAEAAYRPLAKRVGECLPNFSVHRRIVWCETMNDQPPAGPRPCAS
jgi:hypothetical protein